MENMSIIHAMNPNTTEIDISFSNQKLESASDTAEEEKNSLLEKEISQSSHKQIHTIGLRNCPSLSLDKDDSPVPTAKRLSTGKKGKTKE